jgi:hypothetical protein
MPIHDWTRVEAGLIHDFHQDWSIALKHTLNRGLIPNGYYALVEQRANGPEPDVIAVETRGKGKKKSGGGAVVADPPLAGLVMTAESDVAAYARKANRITVRHQLGDVVAVIEIVSPGNKGSRAALRSFVNEGTEFLKAGIHLLVVDLFPPTKRDPQGLHKEIWDEFRDEPYELPADRRLTLVGYDAGEPLTAYIERVAVGDTLPDMPLFLERGLHVPVPLEATYMATWAETPEPIRELVLTPRP